ncbi:hypothetical protein M0802_011840 [Mischocyttarus mexicanus]|nr:hypothetical protein M0802_011840 [Mischocyttarus mexicanus]
MQLETVILSLVRRRVGSPRGSLMEKGVKGPMEEKVRAAGRLRQGTGNGRVKVVLPFFQPSRRQKEKRQRACAFGSPPNTTTITTTTTTTTTTFPFQQPTVEAVCFS